MARRRHGRSRKRRRWSPPQEKDSKIYIDGEVEDALPNTMFKVRVDGGHEVLAHVCGKMRRHRIRVLPGDRVSLELSGYDPSRGRITSRHREPARMSR